MDILVNDNVVNTLLNDAQFKKDFKAMLSKMIDDELAKQTDEMDCDLIDELTDMLIGLEQEESDGLPVIIPPITAKQIMKAYAKRDRRALSWGMRASIVACVLLFSTITCNAAVTKITGRNIAQEVATSIEEKLTEWGIVSFADETNETSVKAIPIGNENLNGGFEDDETGNENIDGGFDDDEKGNENINGGFDDNDEKGNENIDGGFEDDEKGNENIDGGFEDDKPKPAAQYIVTFDSAGGSVVPSKLVSYGKPIGYLPTPTREGYIFKGWYNIDISFRWKNAVAGFMSYKEALPITPATVYRLKSGAILTAQWEKAYTITFDAAEGTCDVKSMTVDSTAKLPSLPVPKPNKEGYIFDYWYYKAGFSNIRVDESTVYTKDTTLYAKYVIDQNEFVMSFYSNGSPIEDIEAIPIFYGKPYGELPAPKPAEDGLIFIGWFDGKNINSNKLTAETVHNERTNVTANALWTKRIYTTYLDVNGGNEVYEPIESYQGHTFRNLPTPTREGYTFKYWDFYGVSADGYIIPDMSEYDIDEITLVAVWEEVTTTIIFDGNGGDVRKNNYTYCYDKPYGKLPEASRPNYDFAGWYTEPEGGELITEESLVKIPESGILYAHWTEAADGMVYVTVHNNRSIDDTYTIELEPGSPLGNIQKPPSTTSSESNLLTFLGWFDDKYYGNKLTADTVINENIDIYAHWGLSSIAKAFVKIKITGVKENYYLDEPIDFDSIEVKLVSPASGVDDADFREIIEGLGETMEEHFINADTSTPGKHTMTFRFAREEFVLIGLGTVYLEQDVSYNVIGCRHTQTQLQNFVQADCRQKGYTGDVVCVDCGAVLEQGHVVDMLPHGELKYIEHKEPTCTQSGYEAHYVCSVCGEAVNGVTTLAPLNHPSSHLEKYREPTCAQYGYTGDMVCDLCGAVTEAGSLIDKLSHGETELVGAKAPTCSVRGYTGDKICTVCGLVAERGSYINKLNHQIITVGKVEATCANDGYTGDEVCAVCGETINTGKVIKAKEHVFMNMCKKAEVGKEGYSDNTCLNCGYTEHVIIEALEMPVLSETSHIYDGKEFKPELIVKDVKGNTVTSYSASYPSKSVEAGTYTVKITFNGFYSGTYELKYTILAPDNPPAPAENDTPSFTGYDDDRALTLYWNTVEGIDGYEFQL